MSNDFNPPKGETIIEVYYDINNELVYVVTQNSNKTEFYFYSRKENGFSKPKKNSKPVFKEKTEIEDNHKKRLTKG